MSILAKTSVRTRLTLWYVGILAILLALYVTLVFAFQYALVQRQIYHDEIQDVETVEGLLYFDGQGALKLDQNYHSHPSSHLLIDRMMEVREITGAVLYRSEALGFLSLGGPNLPGEGVGTFNQRTVTLADGTRVALISHVHPVRGHPVLIRLAYSLAPFHERMLQFFLILLIALPVALLMAGFAGFSIAKRTLRPLQQMADRAEQITATNLSDSLDIENPHDELGHIAKAFNQLLQRLEEAFEQLKRFTADAAHELRTPIASLRAVGEVALQDATRPEDYREAIGSMLEETDRLNQAIEGLLVLAKAEASKPGDHKSSFLVTELLEEVLTLLGTLVEEQGLMVKQDYAGSQHLRVFAERSLVRMALTNVLHNAIKFSPEEGEIEIRCIANAEGGYVEIAVEDEGPGIMASELSNVFDRFFTSGRSETSSASGTGLGLSIAKLAIERNDGEIFFDPDAAAGARCIVRLPLAVPQ